MAQLLQLALAEVGRWARPVQQLCDFSDDFGARGVGEARELLEMLGEKESRVGALQRRSDEDCALRGGRERDGGFGDRSDLRNR
jgi:hypothetical protein